jgi:hypothetical protein
VALTKVHFFTIIINHVEPGVPMQSIYVSIEGCQGMSFVNDDGRPNGDSVVTINVDTRHPTDFADTCVELLSTAFDLGNQLPDTIFLCESVCPAADLAAREAIRQAFPTVTLGTDLSTIYEN